MSYGTTASRQVLFFIDTEQLLKLQYCACYIS